MSEAELEALYLRMEKPLYNVVYRWVWNREEAQDLVQESFVRLWRMRERIRPGKVDPLVYRIALNLAASRRRTKKVWRWVSLDVLRETGGAGRTAEDNLMDEANRTRVRAAVDALPDKLRKTVVLCECSGLSHEEIGKILGISPGTVGSRRHRALKLLKRKLVGWRGHERKIRQSV